MGIILAELVINSVIDFPHHKTLIVAEVLPYLLNIYIYLLFPTNILSIVL